MSLIVGYSLGTFMAILSKSNITVSTLAWIKGLVLEAIEREKKGNDDKEGE